MNNAIVSDYANGKRENWKVHSSELQQQAADMIHEIGKTFFDSPEKIAELLSFGAQFHKYSLKNMKLVYMQNSGAKYIQSFEAWKKMDPPVNVKRGEKGIKIFVPVQSTFLILGNSQFVQLSEASPEQKNAYKKGLLNASTKTHFKIGNVFDISQTDYPVEKYPEIFSVGYKSEQHNLITRGLEKYAINQGINVKYENLESIAKRGCFKPNSNQIVINSILDDTQKLSTFSHELGHALEDHGNRDISLAQKEFEADSISILIQSKFDIQLTDSRKSHLGAHYRAFEKEIKEKDPNITDDDVTKKLDEALTASINLFKEKIEEIQKYVDQELGLVKESNYSYFFEVNECEEFTNMGKTYKNILTATEALKTYKDICKEEKPLVPGINIVRVDSNGNMLETIPISRGKTIDLSLFNCYPTVKEDLKINKAIKELVSIAKQNEFETYGSYRFENDLEQQTRRHRAGR